MNLSNWDNLVAEAQFARELTVNGLSRLCTVQPTTNTFFGSSKDHIFSVHVGLYSYVAGLERFCKLTIACDGYATSGAFPDLKKFSHGLVELLAQVERVSAARGLSGKYSTRPSGDGYPELEALIDRVAGGPGRYEHLDSLWREDAEASTFNQWCSLAADQVVAAEVRNTVSLRAAMQTALEFAATESGLESTAYEILERIRGEYSEESVGVTLNLYRITRWVCATLAIVADGAMDHVMPMLSEAVNGYFLLPSPLFFSFHIAGISDEDVVAEELPAVFDRIKEMEESDED